jgi:hypothetical protein
MITTQYVDGNDNISIQNYRQINSFGIEFVTYPLVAVRAHHVVKLLAPVAAVPATHHTMTPLAAPLSLMLPSADESPTAVKSSRNIDAMLPTADKANYSCRVPAPSPLKALDACLQNSMRLPIPNRTENAESVVPKPSPPQRERN